MTQVNWRDHLAVHPAAELFPLMSRAELRELADDIKKNGLQAPIILWTPLKRDDLDTSRKRRQAKDEIIAKAKWQLIDGRNRLDACALLDDRYFNIDDEGHVSFGRSIACIDWPPTPDSLFAKDYFVFKYGDEEPYALALSFNVRRRHLSAERRRDLIAKVLKAKPEASNRQIAKQVKADDKTVASVRRDLESTAEIPQLEKTIGVDGKARKKRNRLDSVTGNKPIAEDAVDTPQDFWQCSLANLAGDAISMEAFWKCEFGDWEKFEVTSEQVTLAEQAAEAWTNLAAKLKAVGEVADKAAA